MEITSRATLRSITNEAGRQADYYNKRSMDDLSQFWGDLEALAYSALQTSRSMHIELRDTMEKRGGFNPTIIKPCQ